MVYFLNSSKGNSKFLILRLEQHFQVETTIFRLYLFFISQGKSPNLRLSHPVWGYVIQIEVNSKNLRLNHPIWGSVIRFVVIKCKFIESQIKIRQKISESAVTSPANTSDPCLTLHHHNNVILLATFWDNFEISLVWSTETTQFLLFVQCLFQLSFVCVLSHLTGCFSFFYSS